MQYVIAFFCFLIVIGMAAEGLSSPNPYAHHDSVFFIIYTTAAFVSGIVFLVCQNANDKNRNEALAVLGAFAVVAFIGFLIAAFVYMMYMFASGGVCVQHYGNVPRCN